MSREIELKYKIPTSVSATEILENSQISKYFNEEPHEIEMFSTYFDTAENALGNARSSVRIRTENGVSVITLKCALSSDGALARRGEWEVHADSVNSAIPELLEKGAPENLLSIIEKAELFPIAQFAFTRKTVPLSHPDFSAHLCVDDGYLSNDGVKKQSLHELELELISGDETSLRAMGEALCKLFSLSPEPASKLTRARNL